MRRRVFLAAALGSAWCGGSVRADVWGVRPAPRPPEPESLSIARAALGGTVAWAVRDAATGALLASNAGDVALPPASTLKVATTLFALDRLGAGHRFTTRVLLDGGRLVLAGGGDPALDTDGLAALARQVAPALRGAAIESFAVWGGALPGRAAVAAGQAPQVAYNPAVSGINLNFNRVHLNWGQGGSTLRLEARADAASPAVAGITARTTPAGGPAFAWTGDGDGERWVIARRTLGRPGSRWLPVRHPEGYAGEVFRTLLAAEGVALPAPLIAAAPPAGREVGRRDSPPLDAILRDMMEYSTNLTAEVVGLAASGAADAAGSAAAMEGWLRQRLAAAGIGTKAGAKAGAGVGGGAGVGEGGLRIVDHSGLDAGNRITAAALSALCATGGVALSARMKRQPPAGASGAAPPMVVSGKTGTLNFVSNLAGTVLRTDRPGPGLSFAILCADEDRRAASAGEELPLGVLGWTGRAKALQMRLVEGWAARWG